MEKKVLGRIGEEMAARILEKSGYRIIARNFRCCAGEVDIIASKECVLCFIEVKTRTGYGYGRPCEAVGALKQEHIREAALCYLEEWRNRSCRYDEIRFDVMEITVEHIEGAF